MSPPAKKLFIARVTLRSAVVSANHRVGAPFQLLYLITVVLGQSSAVHRKRLVLRLRKRGLSDFLQSDVSIGRYLAIWMT